MVWDEETALVAFEAVPLEFPDHFEVDSSLSPLELENDDGLIEIESGEVVIGTDGYGCGCAVVQRSEILILAGGTGFPFAKVVQDQFVLGVANKYLRVFDS